MVSDCRIRHDPHLFGGPQTPEFCIILGSIMQPVQDWNEENSPMRTESTFISCSLPCCLALARQVLVVYQSSANRSKTQIIYVWALLLSAFTSGWDQQRFIRFWKLQFIALSFTRHCWFYHWYVTFVWQKWLLSCFSLEKLLCWRLNMDYTTIGM